MNGAHVKRERARHKRVGSRSDVSRQEGAASLLIHNVLERAVVLAFFGWMVYRLIPAFPTNGWLDNCLLIVSEGLVVFFVLVRRRPQQISASLGAWVVSLGASIVPLLVNPGGEHPAGSELGRIFLIVGAFIQIYAKVILGRSFGLIPAHRGLKRAGPYRFVRHPIYAGYLLCHLGFFVLNPIFWNLIVYLVCYGLQIPRLFFEEKLLSQDPRYLEYRQSVRYRLIPGVF